MFKLLRILWSILWIIPFSDEIINNDFKIAVKIPDSFPGKAGDIKEIDFVVVHKRPELIRNLYGIIKRVVPAPGLFSEIQDKGNNGIPCFLPQLCPICTAIVTDDPKRHILVIGALVFDSHKRYPDIDMLSVLIHPVFGYIPFLFMDLAVRLIHGNGLGVYKSLLLQDLLSVKQQAVYDICENIIKCFQGLTGNVFLSQTMSPP